MFFLMGISGGRKEFDFTQSTVCAGCGRYGSYIVYMTYTVLSLFFIPCFKWNRQYFVRMSCCGKTYRLDPEVGKCIARGSQVEIRPEDLEEISSGPGGWYSAFEPEGEGGRADRTQESADQVNPWTNAHEDGKKCAVCGYEAPADFVYCPKCGHKL